MLAALVAAVVLLREILLPFVAGMVLAYLLDPGHPARTAGHEPAAGDAGHRRAVHRRRCRAGDPDGSDHRQELAYFIEHLPRYVGQLQSFATDPSRPWLSKIIGEGLGHAEKSIGELTTLAVFATFLRSVWSGGQALISVFSWRSTPIVACYLIYD